MSAFCEQAAIAFYASMRGDADGAVKMAQELADAACKVWNHQAPVSVGPHVVCPRCGRPVSCLEAL